MGVDDHERPGQTPIGRQPILFEEAGASGEARPAVVAPDPLASQFDDEPSRLRSQLRATVEQYETQVEEANSPTKSSSGASVPPRAGSSISTPISRAA